MVDRRTLAAAATGNSGAPRRVSAEPNTDPAVPSLMVVQDGAGGARTPLTWGAASGPVVVGAIPQQPPGFLPRPALLKQLNRVDWAGPAVHVVAGMPGAGT